jgi:hypothetical protein
MMPAILKRTAVLWALVLAACTIQLVPSYDQALVEGLDQANTQALTLFASVESGSPASEFGDYEDRYATLIGTFDALRQRAANRQIPPLAARLSKVRIVRDFCNSESDPAGCVNVSPASLDRVLQVLRRMRDRHRSNGLAEDTVGLFRTDYNTAIAQALTVENALKR